LIADKAPDSQSLGEQLTDQQIELIAAHRKKIERRPKHKMVAPDEASEKNGK